MTDEEYYQFQEWKRKQPQSQPQTQPKPTQDTKPIKSETSQSGPRLELALTAFLFGIPLWCAGTWYTFGGWVLSFNTLFQFFHLPLFIAPVVGWGAGLAIPLGLLYSRVEVKRRPVRWINGKAVYAPPLSWLLWILIIATDVGTTFLGVISPARDAWTITMWIAHTLPAAGIWSLILTFSPEWIILGGIRFLKK